MKTILFQGDSITDAGRSRENDDNRGLGYPTLVAAKLGAEFPAQYKFINKGISGNRVVDLYARIKSDFINIKPDYITILIGINDVWHEVARHDGVENKKFYRVYCDLISEIKEACPDTEIIILEPFVLKAAATESEWDTFRSETELRAASAKAVAEKFGLPFIPLMEKFDKLCEKAEASYWLADGVHPTAMGHEIIAEAVCEALKAEF